MATKKDDLKNENTSNPTKSTSTGGGTDYQTTVQQQQSLREEQQRYQIDRAIDQTRENVRRSIEEARREIPEYAQSVTDYHQQAMDSAEEITDNYLDSQKQIINSAQESWTNYMETVYWWMSPRKMAEMYAQAVSNLADNTVAASRIWNKTVLANMDASKVYLGRTREASKDISRINVNTARTFERTSSQIGGGSSEGQRSGERFRQR